MKSKVYLALLMSFVIASCSQKTVTISSLLEEMVDRESIARFPEPSFTLKQFSSYDRATTQPGDSSWFANWDRSMFIRTDTLEDRIEYVMFDAKGPGVLVRFWMTFAGENSGKGKLRIYFDNETIPSIEGTAFDVISGGKLTGEPLSSSVSDSSTYEMRGHNLYLPLPYARHCKITYESNNIKDAGAKTGGEAVYYNINYRTYAPEVKVISFSEKEMTKSLKTIDYVQDILRKKSTDLEDLTLVTTNVDEKIPPGEKVSFDFSGPNAIRIIKIRLKADSMEQALRSTIVEMTFDGKQTVWCPIGDFFGTGYQVRYSSTWYSEVLQDGLMTSLWVMPFEKTAVITLHNLGQKEVSVMEGEISTAPWKWDKRSMHFGSSWHQFTNLFTGEMKNNAGGGGAFDINYVELTGKGVYAGDAITLFNTVYAWWGEGDEKIYVDGENFPSHIGTGTEDYYGYAWCRPEKFANHPFIGQPDGSGNFWPGYTVNLRYRSLDGIPFNNSLKVDMEMWHWTRAIINFAPVTFWYVLPGGETNIKPDMEGALAKVALNRTDIIPPYITQGKMEAENMILKSHTAGNFRYQNSVAYGWSDNMQAFWSGAKPGDTLRLVFMSENDGVHSLGAHLTLAPDYGKFRIMINSKYVPGVVNLHGETLSSRFVDLGRHKISKGENEILFEIVGFSPDNEKAYLGFDLLTVK